MTAKAPARKPRKASSGPGKLTLLPSAARTAATTGDAQTLGGYRTLLFQLDVTVVSGTTPTLDVKLQTTVDGTNWFDFAAFAQATIVSRQWIRVSEEVVPNVAQAAAVDGTLAAATVHQGGLGLSVRAKHATPGGTTPNFTYSVTAVAWE